MRQCQTHLTMKTFASLHNLKAETADKARFVSKSTRGTASSRTLNHRPAFLQVFEKRPFRVEVR